MLLREHHHPGGVTQLMALFTRVHNLADTVIDNQPTVPGQDGRSAAADFKPLPGRHRSRQPVMRSESAEPIDPLVWHRGLAVGNPDALPIEIHVTGSGVAGSLLRSRAGKKRSVEHAQLRVPGGIRNGEGKEAGIFVIHTPDVDALIRTKGREPQALPVEEIT